MESNSLSLNKIKKTSETIDRNTQLNNESNTQDASIKKSKKKKDENNTTNNKEKSSFNIKKKRVTWLKNLVTVVDVSSFKRYNLENCHDDPNTAKEKTRCNCIIF